MEEQGDSFAWADDSNTYAVQEGKLKIRSIGTLGKRRMAHLRALVHLALKELMVVRYSVPAEEALLSSGVGRRARSYGGLTLRLLVSFVSLPRHLVLTGPVDLLVRDWHPCRYHLRGPTLCPPV